MVPFLTKRRFLVRTEDRRRIRRQNRSGSDQNEDEQARDHDRALGLIGSGQNEDEQNSPREAPAASACLHTARA